MNVLDLFSGIGGFSLGLERAGMKTIAFCEIDPFCQKVLKKHWPNIPCFDDIKTLTKESIHETIDLICGGFPCQDLSSAGKQKGIEAERSGLWFEMLRLINDIRPRYVIVENVTNLLTGERGTWFGKLLGSLAKIGYDAEWHCIRASSIGLPHRRDRIWIVAYPTKNGRTISNDLRQLFEKNKEKKTDYECTYMDIIDQRKILPPIIAGMDDGLSKRSHEISALGNAVVPQIPELIGKAIMRLQ